MRWSLVFAALSLVLAPTTALAGTPEEPEITDPTGDAGVEGIAAPAGGEDLDIRAAWFTANDTGIWANLELVSFEVHPEDVVFSVDASLSEDRWFGVGYGSYIVPFPPFRTQGFQGCTGTEGQQPNCTTLEGEMLDDRPGFAVRIPPGWIEGEDRLRDPTATVAAYAMFPAVTFDQAGPGEAYPLQNDTTDETNLTSTASGAPPDRTDGDESPVPGPGLAATAIAACAVALVAGRR